MSLGPLPGQAAQAAAAAAAARRGAHLLECRTMARPTALIQSSFSCTQAGRHARECECAAATAAGGLLDPSTALLDRFTASLAPRFCC